MPKSFRLLMALALGGVLYWGWNVLFPSPERAIRSMLSNLARTASFDSKQGLLVKGYHVQKLGEFFTPDIAVNLESRGYPAQTLNGRDELLQAILVTRQSLRGLTVEFLDVTVTVAPDRQSAVVLLTGKATVPGEREFFVQELSLMLKKMDRKWQIFRVETVKALSGRKRSGSVTENSGRPDANHVGSRGPCASHHRMA